MATTYYTDIQKLYVAYFNRPADTAGLEYYEGVLEKANGSATVMAQISADFAKSSEYTAAFQGKTNEQIVDIIYTNLFGHAADAAGRKFYADNLTAGASTVANVVQEVAKGAQGTDMTAYNNKVTAAGAFTTALDTAAEKAGYSGAKANDIAKQFLASVTTDASLATAISPAALNGSVAAAVAAGTTFSVPAALAQLDAASTAMTTFVESVDVDGKPATVTKPSDITGAKTSTVATVAADLKNADGTANTAAATLFNTTTSSTVRAALISEQQSINAKALTAAQTELTEANAEVAKVAGLSAAQTTLSSATTAQTAANTAAKTANADEAAKIASFEVNNNGTVGFGTNSSGTAIMTVTINGTTTTLATIAAGTGRATVASGLDATKFPGVTDVIAAYNASVAADANVVKANDNVFNAKLAANMLDIAADDAGTIVVAGTSTTYTEKALVAAIATQINLVTPNTVAAGATPTVAQIQTALAVLKADPTKAAQFTTLTNLVNAEVAGTSAELTNANGALEQANDDLDAANVALEDAKDVAIGTQEDLDTEMTDFGTAHAGVVSVVNGKIVLTPADTSASVVTIANISATTGKATIDGALNTTTYADAGDLILAFNADVDADADVVAAQDDVDAAQLVVDAAQDDVDGISVVFNPLTADQTSATAAVKAANDAITKLTKDVTAMNTAASNADKLAGYQATYDAAVKFLDDNGYVVTNLDDAAAPTQFAGADSDIFVVGEDSVSISAFGLQGNDSVFVGTGFTLIKGAIGATGVKGSDTAMEIFLSTNASGDAQLQIETHAYSSAVATTAGEIVTITLVGVDASTLGLSTDGIITAGTASA